MSKRKKIGKRGKRSAKAKKVEPAFRPDSYGQSGFECVPYYTAEGDRLYDYVGTFI